MILLEFLRSGFYHLCVGISGFVDFKEESIAFSIGDEFCNEKYWFFLNLITSVDSPNKHVRSGTKDIREGSNLKYQKRYMFFSGMRRVLYFLRNPVFLRY